MLHKGAEYVSVPGKLYALLIATYLRISARLYSQESSTIVQQKSAAKYTSFC